MSILIAQKTDENAFSTFLYLVLAIPILVGIEAFKHDKKKSMLFFYSITPLLLIISKFALFKVHSVFPIYLFVGVALGMILAVITYWNDIFPPRHKNERSAKEVGKLLSNFDNIAILGKPGSGKSTYAQFIALTLAQEKAGNKKLKNSGIVKRKFGINEWYLPIFIPLSKVSKYINPSTIHGEKNICLEAFKQEVLPANMREVLSDSYFRHMLTKKKCILLLDGLDEVSNEEHFRVIVNEIQGLVSQYPGNKFLITSRHTGWRGGVGAAFQITEVNDLDSDQISTFAYSWYESIEINRQLSDQKMDEEEKKYRKNRASIKAEQLVDAIEENDNIRNLARNPLLLSMICYVHYNKTLPKERLSLYEDCSRLLLEQWDIEKGLPQDDIPLNYSRKEIIMQEIAYTLHSGKPYEGSGVREIVADEIVQVIGRVLAGFNLDPSQAEVYFNKLVARTGLIISTEQYKDLYGFSHLTFQEFYTAKYLSRHNINIFTQIDENDVESQDRLSSWWREVIILHSGMEKDISEIITSLCSNTFQDYLGNRIQIAAQCLVDSTESPRIDAEFILLRELFRIRSKGEIIEIQGKINSFGRKYLLDFASSPEFYTYALRTRLEDISTQEEAISFAEKLLKFTKSPDKNIQSAAIVTFQELVHKFDVSICITEDVIDELVKQAGVSILLVNILGLLDKVELVPSENLLTTINDTCIKLLCDDISTYYKSSLKNDLAFCHLLELINEKSLINNPTDTNEYIAKSLAKIFKDLPPYRSYNAPFKLPLRNYISCLIRILISTSKSDAEKELVKSRLLEMLRKGDSKQRAWSILIIGKVFNFDKVIIKTIYGALNSPNKIVRLSAISSLRQLDLDATYVEKVQAKYQESIAARNKVERFWLLVKETVNGIGALGDTEEERIQIAGSLLYMNNTLGIQNLVNYQTWSDIYENRYEWSDMLCDVSQHLSVTDIEKISDDLVAIASNPDNEIDFIDDIINSTNKVHELLLNKLMAQLYVDTRGGALGLLSKFKPKIDLHSKEYEIVKEGLLREDWNDANGAYKILENNNLIPSTIFIN